MGLSYGGVLSERVIGLAIEVHRQLGPGLLESAYEECLCFELAQDGIAHARQVPLPVVYKEIRLDCGYRMDPCCRLPTHCRSEGGRTPPLDPSRSNVNLSKVERIQDRTAHELQHIAARRRPETLRAMTY